MGGRHQAGSLETGPSDSSDAGNEIPSLSGTPDSMKPLSSEEDAAMAQSLNPQVERPRAELQDETEKTLRSILSTIRPDEVIPDALDVSYLRSLKPSQLEELEVMDAGRGVLGALFLSRDTGERVLLRDHFESVQKEFTPGTELHVNFYGNRRAELTIGAGDMLPIEVQTIIVTSPEGKRRLGTRGSKPRPGYYDAHGKYIPVFTNYQILIPTQEDIDAFVQQEGSAFKEGLSTYFTFSKKEYDGRLKEETESRQSFIGHLQGEEEKFERGRKIRAENFAQYYAELNNIQGLELSESDLHENAGIQMEDLDAFDFETALGLNEQETEILRGLYFAIAQQESGQNYSAIGSLIESGMYAGERALGKYQIMPTNWEDWSRSFRSLMIDGGFVDESDFHDGVLIPKAKNQDVLFLFQMAEYICDLRNNPSVRSDEDKVKMVAARWYGNMGEPLHGPDDISDRGPAGGPSTRAYTNSVWSHYRHA